MALKTKAIETARFIPPLPTSQIGVYGIGPYNAVYYKLWDGDHSLPSRLGWLSLGGGVDSSPAVELLGGGFPPHPPIVFGLGLNYEMYYRNVTDDWPPPPAPWQPIGGIFNSPPTVTTFYIIPVESLPAGGVPGQSIVIVGLGTDNQPYLKLWNPDDRSASEWLPSPVDWLPLGGKLIYELAIAVTPQQAGLFPVPRLQPIVLFGVGTDRQMFQQTITMGVDHYPPTWPPAISGWQGLGGCFASPPAVAQWAPNRIDVFGVDMGLQMLHRAWENGNWLGDWEPLGGVFDSAPAVVSWGPNRLDIFGLGTDDLMYHKAWDGNQWLPSPTDWEQLGGTFASAPTALAVRPTNALHVFGLGTDFQMYHKSWNGNQWLPSKTDWEQLGGVFRIPRPTLIPAQLDFDATIVFPEGIPVGGNAHLTLSNDSTSVFSGHLHDSGALSFHCLVGCVVKDSKNRAYTFTEAGDVKGFFESGSREFVWNDGGSPNPAITANWNDLFGCGGAKVTFVANVNVNTANSWRTPSQG